MITMSNGTTPTTIIHGHDDAIYNYGGDEPAAKRTKKEDDVDDEPESTPQSRQIRLEQNRKAAKESRRRKKMMIAGMYCCCTVTPWRLDLVHVACTYISKCIYVLHFVDCSRDLSVMHPCICIAILNRLRIDSTTTAIVHG